MQNVEEKGGRPGRRERKTVDRMFTKEELANCKKDVEDIVKVLDDKEIFHNYKK